MTSNVNEVTLLSPRSRSLRETFCESAPERAGLARHRTKSQIYFQYSKSVKDRFVFLLRCKVTKHVRTLCS